MNSSFGSKNRTKCTYNNDESLTEGNRLVTIISTTLKPVHKDHSRINLVSHGQTAISPPYSGTMSPNKEPILRSGYARLGSTKSGLCRQVILGSKYISNAALLKWHRSHSTAVVSVDR